ncbi:LysR family transcriptional regulator [Maritalea sp.]|uniref:LysR family transcriptional regulator n=1 Tax=Maritalea sp. TaxID=2003361 RepID=UPI003EF47729
MNEKPHNWDDLRLFMAVAREGGLSRAAKVTGCSPATLGRRMLALERTLRRDLFIRHVGGYSLTSAATNLLNDLAKVEENIVGLMPTAANNHEPLVKVSAGTWTTLALLKDLDTITGCPADTHIRFVSAECILDIPHREVIIGLRNQRPTEKSLAGCKLSRVEFAPYVTAGGGDTWIKVIADTPSARWLEKEMVDQAVCEVIAPRNCLDLALAGKGKALLPTFIGDSYTELHRASDVIPELTHDQWIVTHQDDRHLPEVRRVINRICAVFENRSAQ